MSPLPAALGKAGGLGFADLDAVEAAVTEGFVEPNDLAGGGVAVEV